MATRINQKKLTLKMSEPVNAMAEGMCLLFTWGVEKLR